MKQKKQNNFRQNVNLTVDDIKKKTKELLKSHKKSSDYLTSTGVYTKKGNLTMHFK